MVDAHCGHPALKFLKHECLWQGPDGPGMVSWHIGWEGDSSGITWFSRESPGGSQAALLFFEGEPDPVQRGYVI